MSNSAGALSTGGSATQHARQVARCGSLPGFECCTGSFWRGAARASSLMSVLCELIIAMLMLALALDELRSVLRNFIAALLVVASVLHWLILVLDQHCATLFLCCATQLMRCASSLRHRTSSYRRCASIRDRIASNGLGLQSNGKHNFNMCVICS